MQGRIYHLTFSPPETEEINARLTQRADDRVENVKPRVQTFQQNLSGVMEMYKSCILRVDGTQDKATIFDRIKERLDSLRKYSVIFVLGGPGRYKEENCEHIAKVYGYKHLNTGDLLRQEHEAGGDMAEIIGKSHETVGPLFTLIDRLSKTLFDGRSLISAAICNSGSSYPGRSRCGPAQESHGN
jgi:adenylate kinase family enzyme